MEGEPTSLCASRTADRHPADLGSRLRSWRRWTDGPFLALAVGSFPLLLLELERDQLPYSDRVFLDAVNVGVLVAFAVDYVVELVLAERRRAHLRREWTSLLIVLAQAIAVLPGMTGFGALRVLRGARAGRAVVVAFRLLALGGAATREGRAILRRRAATFALSMAGLTWVTSAVGFTLAEDVGEGARVASFFDALWWSTATITTVGYGDIFPVTGAGRVIAGFTMLVGISTFAVVTAKVADFLVSSPAEG